MQILTHGQVRSAGISPLWIIRVPQLVVYPCTLFWIAQYINLWVSRVPTLGISASGLSEYFKPLNYPSTSAGFLRTGPPCIGLDGYGLEFHHWS